ncbi:hypothetical protein PGT21_018514 [Puccinia graminis f. sp. tritici]|uniref:Uncharacterized protein n=1 Tax=Puccinia graminis f. sp. tritici TaxID=56615 RepID=A0A5B0NW49_PUCGR|nr:hypothetical protein PGT21_018514 [Puccinia graminis f. sp. tritici]KAA1093365.1 hypothetical protein PGTUg99_026013 [Puccinia graminis f. sp. tritici]
MSRTSNLEKPQEPLDPQETPLVVVNRRIVGFYTGLLQAAPQDATDPRKPLVSIGAVSRPSETARRNGPRTVHFNPEASETLGSSQDRPQDRPFDPRTSKPSEGPLDGPDLTVPIFVPGLHQPS